MSKVSNLDDFISGYNRLILLIDRFLESSLDSYSDYLEFLSRYNYYIGVLSVLLVFSLISDSVYGGYINGFFRLRDRASVFFGR